MGWDGSDEGRRKRDKEFMSSTIALIPSCHFFFFGELIQGQSRVVPQLSFLHILPSKTRSLLSSFIGQAMYMYSADPWKWQRAGEQEMGKAR